MEKLIDKIDMNRVSPMMRHYLDIKRQHEDCIILYRLGDFYEMFFDDALLASKILDITLTGRDCGLDERAPMCGVPYHAVDSYVSRLVSADQKVAICEQLTEAGQQKGMVERDIVRVISAGTIIEDSILDGNKNNYLACVYITDKAYSVSWVDISTGEFCTTEGVFSLTRINNVLSVISPSELICNSALSIYSDSINVTFSGKKIKPFVYFDWAFTPSNANANLLSQLKTVSMKAFSLEDKKASICSAGALLEYLRETQKRSLTHIRKLVYVPEQNYMILDSNTTANLELLTGQRTGKTQGSMLWAIDNTVTRGGSRLLVKWISQPLQSAKAINARLDATDELIKLSLFGDIAAQLEKVRDIERILSKVVYGSANPQHLIAMYDTLAVLPNLRNKLSDCKSPLLCNLVKQLKDVPQVSNGIFKAIRLDAGSDMSKGGYINKGFNKELDTYFEAKSNGKEWLLTLEAKEKEVTGIRNLKVSYNKVFGYYIEVSKSNLNEVPYRYVRKQTLVNGERFITEELKEIEDKLVNAEVKSLELEQKFFNELISTIVSNIVALQDAANALAVLDCLCSFAICAVKHKYIKPTISDKGFSLSIKGGRHPVVEEILPARSYIANDIELNDKDCRVMVLTGPNMSGKSTYMKSIALITLLAHIGSFVPAASATIPVVDRIFTRIGASDDLLNNQSTFMVEMLEVAEILNCATPRSLLLLDEVGRGTSTYDGLSLAWAIIEHINSNIKCKTLFSTHYHEITELESKLEGIKNYKVLVDEQKNTIVFLHKISRGPANKSFGIEVAALAGVPEAVIGRAKEINKTLDAYRKEIDVNYIVSAKETKSRGYQPTFVEFDDKLKNQLLDIDINSLSPMQALIVLADLVKLAKE